MRGRHILLLAVALWCLGVTLSHSEVPAAAADAIGAAYQVHGVLQTIDREHGQATIAHEEIAGYMPAMTMTFDVRDPTSLTTLQAGDLLNFRLCVNETSAWIEQVHKTGVAASPPFEPAAAVPGRKLAVGDLLPDLALATVDGQSVHLRDFRGQALAITFVYARCPLPNYCPLINRDFQTAQTLLARLADGDNWHFLSISIDAAHDSPDVLADIAAAYGADAQHWSFVTAPEEQVRQFGRLVGLEFNTNNGQISHNLRTVVVDASGHIRQILRGNTWTPQELAADMRSAAASRG